MVFVLLFLLFLGEKFMIVLVKYDDIIKKIESIFCEGGYVFNIYICGIER